MVKSSPINSTHYAKLYPQNNERFVTIESVTSFHAVNDGKLINRSVVFARRRQCALPLNTTVAKLPAAPILGKVVKKLARMCRLFAEAYIWFGRDRPNRGDEYSVWTTNAR